MAMLKVTELPPEAVELDPVVITVINSFSKVFMVVVAVFFGMLMMRRTSLGAPFIETYVAKDELPKFSWRWFNLAIGISLLGSLVILVLDRFVFLPQIDVTGLGDASMAWWHGLLAMFYGGITEEIL